MTRSIISLIVAGSTLSSAAELPVREVILYKNGVGYFERGGEVRAGEPVRLDFKAEEMNDVLKSLIVHEASKGVVTGIRYDSAEPLDRKLGEYPFRLNASQPLSALLDQLKGAQVETNNGSGIVAGSRILKGKDGEEREQLTLLDNNGALRSFDLAAVTSLKFSDPVLQQQFRDYFATLTSSRSKDKKSVYIDSATDKSRNLSASYLIPTPVWKSSYRLILDSANTMLEGWAIVDNTSGEDWTKVKLSLVSGRPVSFQSQMYAPRYVQRPFADLSENQPVAPQLYESSVMARTGAPPPPAALGGNFRAAVKAKQDSVRLDAADVVSNIAVNTQAQEVGELFEYRFDTPVTVRKSESAMLPFLQQKTAARKLLVWTSGLNPRNAAEITNSTGKTLDGGPITVFDGGAYGGEALMETVKQGDKRLISYAVDLGTRITNNIESGAETVREVKLNRGILTTKVAQRQTTTYTINNTDAKAKTLIIEHPLNGESKIIGTQPVETTSTARRFEVALKPNASETYKVIEETILDQSEMISNYTPDDILNFVRSKSLSDSGRAALQQIADKKRALATATTDLAGVDRQLNDLNQDQNRLRENIRSLSGVAGQQDLVQRYAKQLSDGDTQITGLRDRQSALRRQQTQLQAELNTMIEKLSF